MKPRRDTRHGFLSRKFTGGFEVNCESSGTNHSCDAGKSLDSCDVNMATVCSGEHKRPSVPSCSFVKEGAVCRIPPVLSGNLHLRHVPLVCRLLSFTYRLLLWRIFSGSVERQERKDFALGTRIQWLPVPEFCCNSYTQRWNGDLVVRSLHYLNYTQQNYLVFSMQNSDNDDLFHLSFKRCVDHCSE